ncbi:virulence sensor protein bvgS [Plectosphaerella plurivora]|uniref:Virulence sensor protein bvgS n=1 Tax=Plectosphaerella plurivora TaxID=936078 RepID=A0A9P8VP36_9PEZI|nr:virulence sensor protein bvgS [Plectosphaerella plurivora]
MYPPLMAMGLVDLLEVDPRASFVVALPEALDPPSPTSVAYSNPALTKDSALLDVLVSVSSSLDVDAFWRWIRGQGNDTSSTFSFRGSLWTKITLQSKWVVVSRNDHQASAETSQPENTAQTKTSAPPTPAATLIQDMILDKPTAQRVASEPGLKLASLAADLEPFFEVIEAVDWSKTPLGPMAKWPTLLQQTYSQLLCSSQPGAIYWGDEFCTVYNEAFAELVGSRHPNLLGKPMRDVFPDMAPQIERLMQVSVKRQKASNQDETKFFIERSNGASQETYLKWSIVPLMEDGKCLGFTHPIAETTRYELFRRRTKMLAKMGEALGTAKDVKSYWSSVINELSSCQPSYDVPMAIVYSVEKKPAEAAEKTQTIYDCQHVCSLEGVLGVPDEHPMIPQQLQLGNSDDGLAPQFRKAVHSRKPILVSTADGSLPKELLQGIEWRGFGDPCSAAIIVPIRPTKDEDVMGLLVLGLNPRRPYDDPYKLFMQLLGQQLAASLACTVLVEEERRRGRSAAEQAAYDQAMLKEQLAYQTKETIEYTRLFQVVSEFIPNGFSLGDHQGSITFANRLWYRITGHPEGPISPEGFLSCIEEDDREKVRTAYEKLRTTDEVEFEFRVLPSENDVDREVTSPFEDTLLDLGTCRDDMRRHVMGQVKVERAGDGTIIRTFTCLTDVTVHRRTAETAMQRAQEAGNLKRMAELATVGMFDMDMSGRLLGANNVFYEMCGITKLNPAVVDIRPWADAIVEKDLPRLRETLARLGREATPQVVEVRMKTTWLATDKAGNKITAPRWVNATFMPVKDSDGVVQSFTGCLADVSLPKWQLELETERKEEAIESKRQQDNFIDMTSHEMRNPLSAIVHCSDAIIASLAKCHELVEKHFTSPPPTGDGSRATILQLITDSIENAETIVACAQHQKRIVDDILTMSKLDSKLLAVTPCTVNPVQIGFEAIKMFDVEARRTDIDLTMTIDPSFTNLGHEYLDLDPSRVKQVLINLLTNALKFTKSGSTRTVAVSMKASIERPTDQTSAVTFIPRSCTVESEYDQPALEGRRNPVYLLFEVKDTGQGLTEEEKASLFNRFVQASSRTHVKYGGSGLGLFISRRLTELQKGAIGVSSMPGVGSTFAFYIETYVPSAESQLEAESAAAVLKASRSGGATSPSGRTKARTPSMSQRPKQPPEDKKKNFIDGILIVEDNLINQQITRRGLHDRGFKVQVANHGIEALEKLALSVAHHGGGENIPSTQTGSEDSPSGAVPPLPINFILMDIEMPIQDGLTCTRRIRELESQGSVFGDGGRIPIIAVSANARPEQMRQAIDAGCDDVVVKPYRMPELIDTMQVVMKRMAKAEEIRRQQAKV